MKKLIVFLKERYSSQIKLTRNPLKRLDNLEHGDSLAGAEVVDLDTVECRVHDLLESGHVTPGDVHDVDVVAAARTVLGVEVTPVHKQLNKTKRNILEHNIDCVLPCLAFPPRLVRHKASGC